MSEKNPFATHQVTHLSPSQINTFSKNPAKWLTNIAGYKDRLYLPAFTFGNAIEAGITSAVVDGTELADSVAAAMSEFTKVHDIVKKNNLDYDFETCAKRQKLVQPVLTNIIPAYRMLGKPIASQRWVEYRFEGLPVPIRGILDLEYDNLVRDLKTTGRKPAPNPDYHRQLTFYALATDKLPKIDFIYWTTKQSQLITMDVPDMSKHIQELQRTSMKMMKLLSMSDDIREVCAMSCLEPDLSNTNFWDRWGKQEILGAETLFL